MEETVWVVVPPNSAESPVVERTKERAVEVAAHEYDMPVSALDAASWTNEQFLAPDGTYRLYKRDLPRGDDE